MENINQENGSETWGADLSPQNRPGIPRERVPPNGTGAHWEVPEKQIPKVKIHKTLERSHLTPVFGTTCPPKGLSGRIRDFAYRNYTENHLRHWFLLLAADRVDVVEGILEDLREGRGVRPIKEMGLKSELERFKSFKDPKKIAIGVAVLGLSVLAIRRLRRA